MADIISALGLHGIPELFRLPNNIDRFKGNKAVLAILAADRTHPEFKKAEEFYNSLDDEEDYLALIAEDQADGPLHERFHCQPGDFFFALIDKDGLVVMQGDQLPSYQAILRQLKVGEL